MKKSYIGMGSTLAILSLGAAVALALEPAPTVVYDNTADADFQDAYYGNPNGYEFGDEISLSGYGNIEGMGIKMFQLSYTVNESFDPTGKKGYLHFYALDGDPAGAGPNHTFKPGTELTAPIEFNLATTPGETLVFPVSFLAPRTFVWSVSFTGLAEGDDVGLDLYKGPTLGYSANDFWVNGPSGWQVNVLDDPGNPGLVANFYAKVLAIPEPTPMQLAFVAGLGLLAVRSIRRK